MKRKIWISERKKGWLGESKEKTCKETLMMDKGKGKDNDGEGKENDWEGKRKYNDG